MTLPDVHINDPHSDAHNDERHQINQLLTLQDVSVLDPFRAALRARNTKRVNVALLGASVAEGFPVTSYDFTIAQRLSVMLRDAYPTAGVIGGRGYVGVPSQGLTVPIASPITISGGAVDPAYGPNQDTFGLGANRTCWYTNGTGFITYTCGPNATNIDLWHNKGTTGGATAGAWSKNGGAQTIFSTLGATDSFTFERIPVSPGDVVRVELSGAGYLIVFGFTEYGGDETKGITVHGCGHSGYTAVKWNTNTISGGWRDELAALSPDLLIISDLGVNDGSGGRTAAQYQTDLQAFITTIRAGVSPLPAVPILLVSDYDPTGGVALTSTIWSSYVAVHRAIATANTGIKHLDLSIRMPSTAWDDTSTSKIYHTDHLHGNPNGSAYSRMAQLIFDAIK